MNSVRASPREPEIDLDAPQVYSEKPHSDGPRLFLVRHPILVGLALMLLFGILRAAVIIRDVLLLGFFAVLIAILMSYPIDLMARKIPRGLAVVLTLLLMASSFVGVGFIAQPTVSKQFENLKTQLPEAGDKLQSWFNRSQRDGAVSQLPQGKEIAKDVKKRASTALGDLASKTIPAAFGALSGLTALILVIVLAAFLVHTPNEYKNGVRSLIPVQYEKYFDESWKRVGIGLQHWMGGIVVSMSIMGAVAATGLWIAGIENWFLLGLLTFFGTFIPYAGAIASAIPGLALGLAQSPKHFFYALLVYLVVHIVEGYIVEPFVMNRAVKLNPATLLFWQAVVGGVFGVMGIVVATPLLVVAQVLTGYLYIEEKLGKAGPKI